MTGNILKAPTPGDKSRKDKALHGGSQDAFIGWLKEVNRKLNIIHFRYFYLKLKQFCDLFVATDVFPIQRFPCLQILAG